MKILFNKLTIYAFIALMLATFGCADLEVENKVEPDSARALANPEDLKSLAGGAFRTVLNAHQEYEGPALAMSTMADQGTCSWGNQAMRDLSEEPRHGIPNEVTYPYFGVLEYVWKESYSAISSANDVLRAILENGIEMKDANETEMVKAWCYFTSGISHGYIGLMHDKGNVIPWETNLDEPLELLPWQDLIDVSLVFLDEAISIAKGTSFTTPPKWFGGESYTNTELAELASSYAARILAYSSRNKAHNESIDWGKVLEYTNNGIKKTLQPELGDNYDFYDFYMVYQIYPGWGRVDHRIINLMDPDYPSRWAEDGVTWTTPDGMDPGVAESDDARLLTDFEYLPDNNFRSDRGYYHFSHYRCQRYDHQLENVWYGDAPKPTFYVWENEMLKAEAMVRTGNVGGAVDILNSADGARKVRGQLPDVTTMDPNEVLWHIFYEKDIELLDSGMGIGYFDMRRQDKLQRGTILHFPIPKTELEIIQEKVYTVEGSPDGENISNGSWTGRDGLVSPPG